ncbi:MAG: hypothetical protein CMK59_09985 [Proteobacteria bacterium]|nr:hypothetical protein [Pseudomonadota bacterium]
MKINDWITQIKRVRNPRPNNSALLRCDAAERLNNFEPDFFQSFIQSLTQEDFITYPSFQDYETLKASIASHINLESEHIYISTGSDSCIKDVIQLTCSSGSEFISTSPCFPMYFVFAEMFKTRFVKVPYTQKSPPSVDSFLQAISDKTRLVILANPNSPVGDFRTKEEMNYLCAELEKRSILFLIDEAYIDFAPHDSLDLIKRYQNVLVVRTFSKAWGGAGARVGYLMGNKKLISWVSNLQLTYPITGPSLKYVLHLLNNKEVVEAYIKSTIQSRDSLCSILENNGYDVLRSHTNSIHFHEQNRNNQQSIDILEQHNVAFKSGNLKKGSRLSIPYDDRTTWIRMSVGPGIEYHSYIIEMLSAQR